MGRSVPPNRKPDKYRVIIRHVGNRSGDFRAGIRVIERLKKSGLEIRDIKRFMEWCVQGSETYSQRRELFLHQKAETEAEIARMNRVLDMLRFKCWYYEQAMLDGNEERLSRMSPADMPEDIRCAYENAHSMDM